MEPSVAPWWKSLGDKARIGADRLTSTIAQQLHHVHNHHTYDSSLSAAPSSRGANPHEDPSSLSAASSKHEAMAPSSDATNGLNSTLTLVIVALLVGGLLFLASDAYHSKVHSAKAQTTAGPSATASRTGFAPTSAKQEAPSQKESVSDDVLSASRIADALPPPPSMMATLHPNSKTMLAESFVDVDHDKVDADFELVRPGKWHETQFT